MEITRKRRAEAHGNGKRKKKESPVKRILLGVITTIAVLIILLYGYLLITA